MGRGLESRTLNSPCVQAARKASQSLPSPWISSPEEEESLGPGLGAPCPLPCSGSAACPGFPVCGKETG